MADSAEAAAGDGPANVEQLLGRAGDPWPSSATFGGSGLEIGGLPAAELAARFGTPLVVVDEDDLRTRCRAAATAWPRVFYAVKAFTAHAVIGIVLDEGLDLLASTGGEVEACLRAGAPGARIAFHGNNKSDDELGLAVRSELGLVIVDNVAELDRLQRAAQEGGRVQRVSVRVVPNVRADTHESIATGHEESKFGVPLSGAFDAVRRAASLPGLELVGIQAHLGSQILDADPYLREVETLVDLLASLASEGIAVPLLDLGGGFGIPYTDERPAQLEDLARAVLARAADAASRRELPPPVIAVEPGRWLVGNPALTLYRVGSIKEAGGKRLVAVDGGMSDNIRPMLYDARYRVAIASRAGDGPMRPAAVVGKHCESGDVLAEDVDLPIDLEPGDLLAFGATGAYTYSMASTYNRVGRPAVAGVRAASATLWLRREDAGDLDRLESGAHRRDVRADPPPDVTIRPASPRDARSFLSFWSAIVREGRYVRSEEVRHPLRVYRSRFRRSWTDREAQVLAIRDGRVVGHVYVAREDHPVTRHVATLGIAVAAEHRGRGIGSALMREAFEWARDRGVEKVLLSVYPHNTAAIALYRKFGFVDEGRLARHSRKSYGYEDEILMSAWLVGDG